MHRLWQTLIQPLLVAANPRVVVEVGSAEGYHTRYLAAYCRDHHARLHVIDPSPGVPPAEWRQEFGPTVVWHPEPSLAALPEIRNPDVILIDGDHNWYTVFHELKILEAHASGDGRFPLVLCHDVGWPYAYRDMYYAPERIPPHYRRLHARRGLLPGQSRLAPVGGFNPECFHADTEGGPRNGVRTAIDDFLRQTRVSLHFIDIPGFHGLGVLAPAAFLARASRLRKFLQGLSAAEALRGHLARVEHDRLAAVMVHLDTEREFRSHLERVQGELSLRDRHRDVAEAALRSTADLVRQQQRVIDQHDEAIVLLRSDRKAVEEERARLGEGLQAMEHELADLRASAQIAQEALARARQESGDLAEALQQEQRATAQLTDALGSAQRTLEEERGRRVSVTRDWETASTVLLSEREVRAKLQEQVQAMEREAADLRASAQTAQETQWASAQRAELFERTLKEIYDSASWKWLTVVRRNTLARSVFHTFRRAVRLRFPQQVAERPVRPAPTTNRSDVGPLFRVRGSPHSPVVARSLPHPVPPSTQTTVFVLFHQDGLVRPDEHPEFRYLKLGRDRSHWQLPHVVNEIDVAGNIWWAGLVWLGLTGEYCVARNLSNLVRTPYVGFLHYDVNFQVPVPALLTRVERTLQTSGATGPVVRPLAEDHAEDQPVVGDLWREVDRVLHAYFHTDLSTWLRGPEGTRPGLYSGNYFARVDLFQEYMRFMEPYLRSEGLRVLNQYSCHVAERISVGWWARHADVVALEGVEHLQASKGIHYP